MIIFVTLALALAPLVRSLQVRVSQQAAFDPANGHAALALKCAQIYYLLALTS